MSEDQIQPEEPERRRVRRDDDVDDRPRRRPRDDYDEEDDDLRRRIRQPDDPTGGLIPYRNPQALIGYYCGVFSIIPCLGLALGPVALILGILGLRYQGKHPTAGGTVHAWIGIVLGTLTTLAHLGVMLVMVIAGAMK